MSLSTPPRPDELEVSVIGPGRGECIILHLGDNEWCIVDSCIARNSKTPVAIQYLSNFQGALERIRLVVATHWHDDHVRGLASVVERATNATFGYSIAFREKEFRTLFATAGVVLSGQSGVDELAKVFDILLQRVKSPARAFSSTAFAIQNRRLLNLSGAGRSFPAAITALSPSDTTIALALQEIGKLLPKTGEQQRRLVNRSPNHASVVLWIEAGCKRILLGADLEHTERDGEGWLAVLAGHQDGTRACGFKVPHHGSENADCPQVWGTVLGDDPVAVITPFMAGTRLPKPSDLDRLSTRTRNLYCTSSGPGKPPSRDPSVERQLKQILTQRRVVAGQPGHVRIRWSANEEAADGRVELFNGAFRIN